MCQSWIGVKAIALDAEEGVTEDFNEAVPEKKRLDSNALKARVQLSVKSKRHRPSRARLQDSVSSTDGKDSLERRSSMGEFPCVVASEVAMRVHMWREQLERKKRKKERDRASAGSGSLLRSAGSPLPATLRTCSPASDSGASLSPATLSSEYIPENQEEGQEHHHPQQNKERENLQSPVLSSPSLGQEEKAKRKLIGLGAPQRWSAGNGKKERQNDKEAKSLSSESRASKETQEHSVSTTSLEGAISSPLRPCVLIPWFGEGANYSTSSSNFPSPISSTEPSSENSPEKHKAKWMRALDEDVINQLKKEGIPQLWQTFPGRVLHLCTAKLLSVFGSTYTCEQTFSVMENVKNNKRNRLTDRNLTAEILDEGQSPKYNQWQNRTVLEWSCQQVSHWLMGLNLEQYIPEFTAKNIDGKQLLQLDGSKLKVLMLSY
ncbi:sterile alpha motif domain-containing protein 14-like [Polyodon spathula]|uniref:sterile alpha motif domain-containing protein 14-like n=1 Tax=Polyodon spathula TaxID=7913 RepID=UPI001B7E13CC|nr:sterile alpha motif domain-containing protein 14-like [Polyodon spathula]